MAGCIKINIDESKENMNRYSGIEKAIRDNEPYNYGRTDVGEIYVIGYSVPSPKDFYHIVGTMDKKSLPKKSNGVKNVNYIINNDKVRYARLEDKYKVKLPDIYYWKTPDDWLYLYDKNRSENGLLSISITEK